MIQMSINPQTMANLRFAYSPLIELTISYRILRGNINRAIYWRWIEEACQAISDLELPYMDALIGNGQYGERGIPKGYIPDFITPTPTRRVTDIEDEFERILKMPDDLIREGIGMLIEEVGPSELLCDFLAYPREGLERLIAEMREYWNRTLAQHWNRMIAVLENDVLHHSRILTLNGVEALFPDISHELSYSNGKLIIDKGMPPCPTATELIVKKDLHIEGNNFYLTPAIFGGNKVWHQLHQPWEPMLIYTPRGAGLWNYETPEPTEALEITLGAGKARLLLALGEPLSTGELAHKLTLTAGAVSQQLGKLHQAGLVEYHRSGKHVFYRLSDRGQTLVSLFY